MIRQTLGRIAAMDRREIAWRATAAARVALDRARFAVAPPEWNRRALARRLGPALDHVAAMLRRRRFDAAHRELSRHFTRRAPCFVLDPAQRPRLVERIARLFPSAHDDAARRGDAVLFGAYDLLGYRGLRFDASGSFAWTHDPVHDRTAPECFWASVPYLAPACGDHKIIWELNRHQHWLTLGRAFWLTGDGKYRDRSIAELDSWLDANPPLNGINWASMLELAFRSLSWLWALHFFADAEAPDRSPWTVDLLLGLDRQLTHVERNLSYYFSPNTHLLGEALALYVCGRSLPELAASETRAATGRRILLEEIGRQIGADGGHCERSAHYHRYALDFYVLASAIARITHDPAAGLFDRAVERLAAAARLLADDRGRLPHLGDDDGGMLLPMTGSDPLDIRDSLATAAELVGRGDLAVDGPHEETSWLLANPVFTNHDKSRIPGPKSLLRSAALRETGYYVSRWPDGTHIVIDGGAHGYQNGGHAHADALSLAVRLPGGPLLVDPGTACYTIDPERRDRFRSSAMHNTVTVDGRSSSTPKGPFHWSHTADATVARWRASDAFDYFEASHSGYDGLVHRRHVLALHGDLLIVADLIDGSGRHTAAAHWHLGPRWTAGAMHRSIALSGPGRAVVFVPRGDMRLFTGDAGGLGWMSPAYGRVEPTTTIRIAHEADAPFWLATVFDLSARQDVEAVDIVPVWAEAGTLARSIGLRIARASSIDYALIAEPLPASARTTWRIAEFETDAHMVFVRTASERQAAWLAIVDGSTVRGSGRGGLRVVLPDPVTALHLDLSSQRAEPEHVALNREPGT